MKWSDEDKQKGQNLKGLFTNPSTRPVVITTGVILIAALIGGYSTARAQERVESSATVGRVPQVTHRPGVNTPPTHTNLQEEENRRRIEEAQRRAGTSLPVLTSDHGMDSPLTIPQPSASNQNQTPPRAIVDLQQNNQPAPQEAPPAYVYSPPPVPVAPQASPTSTKTKFIEGYLSLWGPGSKQFQEFTYAGQEGDPSQYLVQQNQGLNQDQSIQQSQGSESDISFVRAGTTIPAVLITPLNSDAPGPVLAEVTSGPLRGARLIGSMQAGKESILVTFNRISKPGWPETYSISAVGMDQDHSTGLVTDINKHYITRYLGLLGGTFVQGYGQAMRQQGQVTVVDPSGGVVTQRDELDSRQVARSAQGSVLQSVGNEWQRNSNKDATIKVEGKSGSRYPLQVLFLENF